MEDNGDYDTGIELDESDDDEFRQYSEVNFLEKMEGLPQKFFKAIYAHKALDFTKLLNKTSVSNTLIKKELPKILREITKEILKLKSQDANRGDIREMEKMLVHSLNLVSSDSFEKSLQLMDAFAYIREVFLLSCTYGIQRAVDHMLNTDDICKDLQLTLYEGITKNVYSNTFSLSLIERIIKADLDNILTWDDVLDLVFAFDQDMAKQRVCIMLESQKELGYHNLSRIFHHSCRYDWKEILECESLKNMTWKDLKTEIKFCFTRKDRKEIGCLVLQLANGIRTASHGNLSNDGKSESMKTFLSDYISYTIDIGVSNKTFQHQSLLAFHHEIFCDKRIQYIETCLFEKNKMLSSESPNSFNMSSLTVCGKCKEHPNLPSVMQYLQTQHYLITNNDPHEMFETAVRGDNILLVAVLWKLKLKQVKENKQIINRPFELPTGLVRDFSTVSAGMQTMLRDMYCHDFIMRHSDDIYYVDLSLKTVTDFMFEKQREAVFLVAVFQRSILNTTKQPRFGGIPIIWKSLTEIFRTSKIRSEVSLHRNISIPHYIKEKLFRQHRNLTIISVSAKREIGNEVIDIRYPHYCVTLFCWAKGYIPVGEKAFPSRIGSYNTITDVREGYCIFATGNKIFPGGGIYREANSEKKIGTLGGFVEKNGETYGITCAHVLLNEHELMNSGIDLKYSIHADETEKKIGSLYCHAFEYGDSDNVSIDAALVKLDSNVQIEHAFPVVDQDSLAKAGFCDNKPPVYDDGTTISMDKENRNWVIKYGITTGLTYGYLGVDKATSARINQKIKLPAVTALYCNNDQQMETDDDNGNYGYMMYNQTEVYGVRGESFFELGDSGSLVFKIMEGNKLRCLGIAFALTSYGSALVTPIDKVLQSLNAKCPSASNQDGTLRMKKFRTEEQNVPRESNGNDLMSILLSQMQQLQSNIGDNMTRIEAKIDAKFLSVEQKMEEKFVTVENDLQNIKACVFPQASPPSYRQTEECSDEDL